MVYFFKSRCGQTLYMGKDQHENELLIKYGWPEDVWFHVDDLSSAHVYLRMKPGMTMDDISDDVILDCSSLVKANSIAGCKKHSVYVVYTRWKNLKKLPHMVEGQVGYHRPENVRRIEVEKNNSIVRQLEKSKEEVFPDLYAQQQQRLQEIAREEKALQKNQQKQQRLEEEKAQQEKEARSYDRIMNEQNMTSNAQVKSSADTSAAEEYEDDFF